MSVVHDERRGAALGLYSTRATLCSSSKKYFSVTNQKEASIFSRTILIIIRSNSVEIDQLRDWKVFYFDSLFANLTSFERKRKRTME